MIGNSYTKKENARLRAKSGRVETHEIYLETSTQGDPGGGENTEKKKKPRGVNDF